MTIQSSLHSAVLYSNNQWQYYSRQILWTSIYFDVKIEALYWSRSVPDSEYWMAKLWISFPFRPAGQHGAVGGAGGGALPKHTCELRHTGHGSFDMWSWGYTNINPHSQPLYWFNVKITSVFYLFYFSRIKAKLLFQVPHPHPNVSTSRSRFNNVFFNNVFNNETVLNIVDWINWLETQRREAAIKQSASMQHYFPLYFNPAQLISI